MTTIDTFAADARGARRGYGGRLLVEATRLLAGFERRMEMRRSRLALLEMTDEQLKDIGISRGEAFCEAAKPWWQ